MLLPGQTLLVRRTCTQRLGLLGSSPELTQILEYCLAFAAKAARLRIHAYCFFPTHYSLVVTDPDARLPEFTETFHSIVARCLNRHWKRREHFWAQGRPEHTLVPEREDVLDLCAAVLLEPVESRMVRSPHAWPCASTLRLSSKWVARPACLEGGELPEVVQLRVQSPEVEESSEAWTARVRRAVAAGTRGARAWAAGNGKVLGAAAVRAMRPEDYVKVGVARRWGEVWAMGEEVIEAWFRKLAAFVEEHREAARLLRARVRAVFPIGTYGWRRRLCLEHGEWVALRTFPPPSQI